MLIAGAGGQIGGYLVQRLLAEGHEVWAADIKPIDRWLQVFPDAHLIPNADLSKPDIARICCSEMQHVYNLAADMGGIGFIEGHKAECMLSVKIGTTLLEAARDAKVKRFFFSSSACVYPAGKQGQADLPALKESDAYPAMPEDGYGWEKLFTERMCRHFTEDYGLKTRVARFHNIYAPISTFDGGREKAPAAICRKVATAVKTGDHRITIWGDGEQTRSFCYIADCVTGIVQLMNSGFGAPLNIGSSELVTINELVSIVERIAGVELERSYDLTAPTGVRGRNSDNTLCREVLGWEPSVSLADGMAATYRRIAAEVGPPG